MYLKRRILFIPSEKHFPLLKECLFDSKKQIAPASPQSWKFFLEVTRYVPIKKLRLLLAAQPISDITIVECHNQIQFAYLKVAKLEKKEKILD
ncbi:unnamed protein product [Eruca vesicaria subsp. sativa]|uniref:Uncharacterized protein n=1 Tax=Eruca vesicaria subsp. sativa TaxID=29727 RepID=A0ABC8JU02_ERUVS|nr:unnamed protein product [Eruca vesicaria subsp. sativa]